MEKFKNKYYNIALVVVFIVGFFAGMEYKAYQIRSAFNDVAEEIGNIFGGSEKEDTSEKIKAQDEDSLKAARRDEESNSAKRLKQFVDIEVVDKGFTPSDFMNGVYDETINFSFKLINRTEKEVRGVQGEVVFYDIFSNEIYRSSISYDKGIPANDSYVWKAGIDYNEFINADQKLKEMELENLQYEWIPNAIIFADGSKEQ